MPSIRERDIHLRLWEILKNVIVREKFSFEDIEFVDVKFEPHINGKPDLVIEAVEKGKAKKIPLLVIETKRKVPYPDPRFDPYSIDVIKQAVGYAIQMGAPYFATCNGEILVVFDTFTVGVPLVQRRLKQYKVFFDEEFARILLKELVRFKLGVGKWLPLDDIFVERLRSFHRFISPFMYEALSRKLKEDSQFKEEYIRWLKSQLFEYSHKINEKIAEQMAYLLMNKIAFYKTLETQVPELTELKKIDVGEGTKFSEELQERFREVMSKADYEGIFQPTILDRVSPPDKLVYHLNEFIEELGAYNLGKIRSDVLGRVYEDLIPVDERHRLGQYYTPPPIVELIVEMCMRSPNDKVLDPACGSGSFLVKAYHKLRDLKKKENPFRTDDDLHNELLEQIYGIDINPFPAQLSSINLAIRNLKVRSEHINLFPSDFFKVKPLMPPLPKEFDAVITNPPYTRQEEMEYKEQIRDVALTYSDGSKIDIEARAGIYVYFFTFSGKFLKNGGKMGYITSNSWLDVGFGKGLKEFFLNHFIIKAIIEHDARAFAKAEVNTCISILEKAETKLDGKKRHVNIVKFARIKKPMDIKDIVQKLETVEDVFEDEKFRLIPIEQAELRPQEKWGKYLRAPKVFFKIIRHPKMTNLGTLAQIKRGFTTGADEFFYLDKEKAEHWSIEEKYLRPVITSPKDVNRIFVEEDEVNNYVLCVHEEKRALEGKNVLKYIEHGENVTITIRQGSKKGEAIIGYHNLTTIKPRRIWYDLGKRKPAPIIFPRKIWERTPFILNHARALVHQCFYEIHPLNSDNIEVLAGILSSTVTSFLLESSGRSYGGGVHEVTVYEVKDLPVLNIQKLKPLEKKNIESTIHELAKAQSKADKKAEEEARKKLDEVMFNILELDRGERKQVYEGLESLRQMRKERKEVEVLVETPEKWKPLSKRKKKLKFPTEPSKRLDIWIKDG